MKREYMKPTVRVCELQQQCHILAGSDPVSTLDTNLDVDDLEYGGGGAYEAR